MRGDAASGFPVSDSAGLYRDPVRAAGDTAGSERDIRFRPGVGSDDAFGSNNAVGARDAFGSHNAVTPGNAVGPSTAISSHNAVGPNNAISSHNAVGSNNAVTPGNAAGPCTAIGSHNAVGSNNAISSYSAVSPNPTQVAETVAGLGVYLLLFSLDETPVRSHCGRGSRCARRSKSSPPVFSSNRRIRSRISAAAIDIFDPAHKRIRLEGCKAPA